MLSDFVPNRFPETSFDRLLMAVQDENHPFFGYGVMLPGGLGPTARNRDRIPVRRIEDSPKTHVIG